MTVPTSRPPQASHEFFMVEFEVNDIACGFSMSLLVMSFFLFVCKLDCSLE